MKPRDRKNGKRNTDGLRSSRRKQLAAEQGEARSKKSQASLHGRKAGQSGGQSRATAGGKTDDWETDGGEAAGSLDAMDRILEFALEELARERSHGGACSVAPDMIDRVRSAWRKGQRGQDLMDLQSETERPRLEETTRERTSLDEPTHRTLAPTGLGNRMSLRTALAAALVILSVGGIWFWFSLPRAGSGVHHDGKDAPFLAENGSHSGGSQGHGPEDRPVLDDPIGPQPAQLEPPEEDTGSASSALSETDFQNLAELSEPRRARIDERLDALLLAPLVTRGLPVEEEVAKLDRMDLLTNLADDLPAWNYLTQTLDQKLTKTHPSQRTGQRLVALAREAPPRFGTSLGRSLWLRIPASFESFDLVDFADRKLFEFERELVAKSQERDPETWDQNAASEAIAAAWLVNRGDPRGLASLNLALDKLSLKRTDPRLVENLRALVMAGSVLQAVQGGDAWSRTHRKVAELVEQFKEIGNWEGAKMAVNLLEFAYLAPPPPAFPLLGLTEDLVNRYGEEDWQALDERLGAMTQAREQ